MNCEFAWGNFGLIKEPSADQSRLPRLQGSAAARAEGAGARKPGPAALGHAVGARNDEACPTDRACSCSQSVPGRAGASGGGTRCAVLVLAIKAEKTAAVLALGSALPSTPSSSDRQPPAGWAGISTAQPHRAQGNTCCSVRLGWACSHGQPQNSSGQGGWEEIDLVLT